MGGGTCTPSFGPGPKQAPEPRVSWFCDVLACCCCCLFLLWGEGCSNHYRTFLGITGITRLYPFMHANGVKASNYYTPLPIIRTSKQATTSTSQKQKTPGSGSGSSPGRNSGLTFPHPCPVQNPDFRPEGPPRPLSTMLSRSPSNQHTAIPAYSYPYHTNRSLSSPFLNPRSLSMPHDTRTSQRHKYAHGLTIAATVTTKKRRCGYGPPPPVFVIPSFPIAKKRSEKQYNSASSCAHLSIYHHRWSAPSSRQQKGSPA